MGPSVPFSVVQERQWTPPRAQVSRPRVPRAKGMRARPALSRALAVLNRILHICFHVKAQVDALVRGRTHCARDSDADAFYQRTLLVDKCLCKQRTRCASLRTALLIATLLRFSFQVDSVRKLQTPTLLRYRCVGVVFICDCLHRRRKANVKTTLPRVFSLHFLDIDTHARVFFVTFYCDQ